MPPRPHGDPLLATAHWRRIRQHWRQQRQPCARCGNPIDYTAPRGHPRALHVGHIIGRDQARTLGWTDTQINHLSNTQPECTTCSTSSGGTYGNGKRWGTTRPTPIEANDW